MNASIEISEKIKNELDQIKSNENYDQIITKLLKLIPIGDDEGEYTPEFRLELLNAKLEAVEGETIDHQNVIEALGF
ncbi:MAG: hypothetical protein ACTSYA_01350 [Candidatus Kariarchaeaceae archaeon]